MIYSVEISINLNADFPAFLLPAVKLIVYCLSAFLFVVLRAHAKTIELLFLLFRACLTAHTRNWCCHFIVKFLFSGFLKYKIFYNRMTHYFCKLV